MAKPRTDLLVWLDLEMTGLDSEKNRIIEIAVVVTDSDLRVIAAGPTLVIRQPERVLKVMDSWNQKQHQKSGLLSEVRASRVSTKSAERQALQFLKRYCAPQSTPLCGNTVHHDRLFLIRYMPKIHDFLHYRHVDVSVIKDLAKRWFPKLKKFRKKDAHRAMSDVLESIEELKYYRRTLFRL